MSHTYTFERSQLICRPLDEVFAFFSNAENLQALTPAWLHFQFITPLPIAMEPGVIIDYRIRLCGVPLKWRTRIDTITPGESFSDVQLRGPYKRWHHWHEFRQAPEGTLMIDRVEYELSFWLLGRVANALFVRRMLNQIFDYRRKRTEELLAGKDGK